MTERASLADRAIAGFTLVEMIVVLAILGLIAAVTLPAVTTPTDSVRLRAVGSDLLGALRLTRAAAISRHAEMALVLDLEARTLQSPVVRETRFASDIGVGMVIAEPERTSPSRGAFRFFPDGSSTGGDIRLQLARREARICVSWLTGEAREGGDCERTFWSK
jgi:general secretion pathway protein H